MNEALQAAIRRIPAKAFRESRDQLSGLSYAERLRWLQQTAYFVWKYKGVATVQLREKTPPTP